MTVTARPLFRRLALGLAMAQLAVYAALPFAESWLERVPAPVSVEARHSGDCVPLHNPAACLFCQVALARAEPGRAPATPAPLEAVGGAEPAPPRTDASPWCRLQPPSRAPPLLLA